MWVSLYHVQLLTSFIYYPVRPERSRTCDWSTIQVVACQSQAVIIKRLNQGQSANSWWGSNLHYSDLPYSSIVTQLG